MYTSRIGLELYVVEQGLLGPILSYQILYCQEVRKHDDDAAGALLEGSQALVEAKGARATRQRSWLKRGRADGQSYRPKKKHRVASRNVALRIENGVPFVCCRIKC